MPIRLDDMLSMKATDLHAIVQAAAPLDLAALEGTTYTGIDLSMPEWFHKLMWRSFRKTFSTLGFTVSSLYGASGMATGDDSFAAVLQACDQKPPRIFWFALQQACGT